jgi:iron complex transport system substrate-binding protein
MVRTSRRPAGRPRTTWAIALIIPLMLAGCSSGRTARTASSSPPTSIVSPVSQFPVTVVDDDGVAVNFPAKPTRIITFAPSNTEIVFALGLRDELVGVSGSFDDYPPEAKTIEQVGGAGEFGEKPNVEKVVALQPDLFLTIAGGEDWKQRLRDLAVPVFTINATDLTDLLGDIRTVGRITGVPDRASALTQQMSQQASTVATEVTGEAPVSCFFEAFYPPLTTIGPNTFIFDLLERAGCDPVSAGAKSDYPEWSIEDLVAQGPSVYLVASESGVSVDAISKRPGFSAIDAVAQGRVYLVDSDLISRPGPRVIQGLLVLARILHPSAVP